MAGSAVWVFCLISFSTPEATAVLSANAVLPPLRGSPVPAEGEKALAFSPSASPH